MNVCDMSPQIRATMDEMLDLIVLSMEAADAALIPGM